MPFTWLCKKEETIFSVSLCLFVSTRLEIVLALFSIFTELLLVRQLMKIKYLTQERLKRNHLQFAFEKILTTEYSIARQSGSASHRNVLSPNKDDKINVRNACI